MRTMRTGLRNAMHNIRYFVEEIDNAAACLNASRSAICEQEGVRLEQWKALAAIERSSRAPSISQLARRLRRARQSVHSLVQGLERAGWIRLLPNRDDRRLLHIEITRAGQSVLSGVESQFKSWLLIMAFDLSEQELRKLNMTLRSIRARVSRARDYAPARQSALASRPGADSRTAVP
jgi:DNA-binding MarR family transcriptional regulator